MRLLLPGFIAFLVWSAATLALYQHWFVAQPKQAFALAGQRDTHLATPKPSHQERKPFAQYPAEPASTAPGADASEILELPPAQSQPLFPQPLSLALERDAQSGAWQVGTGQQSQLSEWARWLNEQPGAGICVVCSGPASSEQPAADQGNAIRRALFHEGIQPGRVTLVFRPQSGAAAATAASVSLLFVPEDPLPWSVNLRAMLAAYDETLAGSKGLSGEGGTLLTRHFRFAYGSSALPEDPETQNFFTNLSQYLNRHPEKSVCITGHTCDISSASFNQRLGAARAASVRQRLLDLGIAPERLRAASAGEDQPIGGNGSSAGQQANRRVELFIR
jgi:outer membrane protein OmpA-like peptidoglycan-associated protein